MMRRGETLASAESSTASRRDEYTRLVFMVLACGIFWSAASDRGNQGRGQGDLLWDLVERYDRSRAAA